MSAASFSRSSAMCNRASRMLSPAFRQIRGSIREPECRSRATSRGSARSRVRRRAHHPPQILPAEKKHCGGMIHAVERQGTHCKLIIHAPAGSAGIRRSRTASPAASSKGKPLRVGHGESYSPRRVDAKLVPPRAFSRSPRTENVLACYPLAGRTFSPIARPI
jgi:hypothetical protein